MAQSLTLEISSSLCEQTGLCMRQERATFLFENVLIKKLIAGLNKTGSLRHKKNPYESHIGYIPDMEIHEILIIIV